MIKGECDIAEILSQRGGFRRRTQLPSRKSPTVIVSNEESEFYTIADVTTDDRTGLLYDLTDAIARHGLDIYISKAATILDQVTDTFYLKDPRGKKVSDPQVIVELQANLMEAAGRGVGESTGSGEARGR